ncbi:unnamed protein product [Vitrella brassicaformis CCMP3155]|uniref:3'-5' exonuclease domain-containing protein n=2 Tax=Vitrella brassicaformis TaxID=1169539 RepID=A0A0G4GX35_VITBC|nr:unnamed protein product [Vitrella brassicaformis CCMP3155]|mmetsp:Transcript_36614/g.91714  ORF Transcript_36614/g.91714 Transcript_36614/m.91714 type:complete len:227 (+) Transcript_36614:333-1013(+)|eukprot:CEM35480.1 unnamed protein product [Vitrella brassicaformis CCMP3155]
MAAPVIGVDIEHGTGGYHGRVCLLQLSTGTVDIIVDAIAEGVRPAIARLLRPLFESQKILKVFHSAENDIMWLQRDFALSVVNVFDTHQACRALSSGVSDLPQLWSVFCDFHLNATAKKTMQCSDWSRRPLTDEQLQYARIDARFLPHLAAALLWAMYSLDGLPSKDGQLGERESVTDEEGRVLGALSSIVALKRSPLHFALDRGEAEEDTSPIQPGLPKAAPVSR